MDFCHLIVTCLFSMLRLPFDNQKVKGNYAIFLKKQVHYWSQENKAEFFVMIQATTVLYRYTVCTITGIRTTMLS